MIKRILLIAAACGMLLALAACANNGTSGNGDPAETAASASMPSVTVSNYSNNISSALETGQTASIGKISATLKEMTSEPDSSSDNAVYTFVLEVKNTSDDKQYMAIDVPELFNHSAEPIARGDGGFTYLNSSDVYYSSDFALEAREAKEFRFGFSGPRSYGEAYICFRIYGDGAPQGNVEGVLSYPTFAEPFFRVDLSYGGDSN